MLLRRDLGRVSVATCSEVVASSMEQRLLLSYYYYPINYPFIVTVARFFFPDLILVKITDRIYFTYYNVPNIIYVVS